MLSCGLQILFAVLATILGMIIVLYIAFAIYLNYLDQQFIKGVTKNFEQFCDSLPAITYRQPVTMPATNGVYEQNLAIALVDVCFAVSAANCSGVNIPNPPGFTQQLRITGAEPTDGETLMFAYIFWNDTQAIIAFTGTEFMSEWRSDFQFEQVAPTQINNYQPGMLVHKGFNDIYLSIRSKLISWWNSQTTIQTLFITGHSLGGALSTICAYDFAALPTTLVHYSYAAPRSGNSTFATAFNNKVPATIRINNTEDIIPQLPPAVYKGYNYEQTGGNAPFTISLSTLIDDHMAAYKNNLPQCPQVASCNVSS